MPLNGAVVLQNATAMTPTGGTNVTFTSNGQSVPNGIQLIDAAQADFRIQRNMTVKNRLPSLQTDGTYTKGKRSITFTAPKILASGKVTFNVIRIEREVHPESTAAEALELNMLGAQLLSDADFSSFWSAGSLA